MKQIIERLQIVGLVAFAVMIAWFLLGMFTTKGEAAAAISGAEDAWGFQWAANNLGWLFLGAMILVGIIVLVWRKR